MTKIKIRYVCQNCGSAQAKWMGKCPDCGEWNTLIEKQMVETPPRSGAARTFVPVEGGGAPLPLTAISADGLDRVPVEGSELSRVLGGGIVPGSVVLVSGDPGIGKSTLLLQLAASMARTEGRVLYVSAEESARQLKLRASRLGIHEANLFVHAETHLESILQHVGESRPRLMVVELDPGHPHRRSGLHGRQRDPGARVLGAAAAHGQEPGRAGLPGRPRHQGGQHRRPAGAGAHGGHGALPGGRALPDLPPAAQRQEPLRLHRRGGGVRDGRRPGCGR